MRSSPHLAAGLAVLMGAVLMGACAKSSAVPLDAGDSVPADAGAEAASASADTRLADASPVWTPDAPAVVDTWVDTNLSPADATDTGPAPVMSCFPSVCTPGQVCQLVACGGDNPRQCRDPDPPCTEVAEKPVCGCLAVTYPSSCALRAAGNVQIAEGACRLVRMPGPGSSEVLILQPGSWGGRGARAEVTASSVTFQLPCGTGEFIGRPEVQFFIQLTGWKSEFSWQGTYRKTGAQAAVPATFSGRALTRLHLKVSAEPGVEYELELGAPSTALACGAP